MGGVSRLAKRISNTGLFDRRSYQQTYLSGSVFYPWPELHYAIIGERLGFRPNPFFDPAYYRKALAASGVTAGSSLLTFYSEQGVQRREDPSAEFNHHWYGWQNPDWVQHSVSPHPMRHMLEVGLPERRDPSPRIDLRRLLAGLGREAENTPGMALAHLCRKGRMEGPGIVRDIDDLRQRQAAFRARMNFDVLRRGRPSRPNLVFVQSRKGYRPSYLVYERNFDILRNYYADPSGDVCPHSDHAFFQSGTKATGIAGIMRYDPELLLAYENVLFLDDDITLEAPAIDRLFAAMRSHNAMLAQPMLEPGSACVWPVFKDQANAGRIVPVNSVEVMMPAFSREALARLGWTFSVTISGFGMDLLWGHMLADEQTAGRVVLVGEVQARHEKPIDEVGGAFYRFMAENGINPKLELWMVMQQYGVVPEFRAIN